MVLNISALIEWHVVHQNPLVVAVPAVGVCSPWAL